MQTEMTYGPAESRTVESYGRTERKATGKVVPRAKRCGVFGHTKGEGTQIHQHDPDTVFVVPEEGAEFRASATGAFAVYRSTNRGKTWKRMTKGLPPKPSFLHVHRQAMTHDTLKPFGLYVAATNGQIFWSRDNGTSWKLLAEHLPAIYSINAACV